MSQENPRQGVDIQKRMVFTIGHSKHEIDYFVELLNKHGCNSVIDVRSQPYSQIAPQFNKEQLSLVLKNNDMMYIHFEEEFGARRVKSCLLDEDGKVDFDKVRESIKFKQGIQRLKTGIDLGYTIALMCSEADPFDCHRFSMVSYQLIKEGVRVCHILKDGSLKENSELEDELVSKYEKKLPQTNLFGTVTRDEQIEIAYRLRGKDIAFSSVAL